MGKVQPALFALVLSCNVHTEPLRNHSRARLLLCPPAAYNHLCAVPAGVVAAAECIIRDSILCSARLVRGPHTTLLRVHCSTRACGRAGMLVT